MIEVFGIELLRPQWFLALPVIAVIGYFSMPRGTALAGWDLAIDPALLAALHRLSVGLPKRILKRRPKP